MACQKANHASQNHSFASYGFNSAAVAVGEVSGVSFQSLHENRV